jgi:hypothetical protein
LAVPHRASRFLPLCEALESTREDAAIITFEQLFLERGLLSDQSLKQALSLVDVRVLDHFIVAGDQTLSFAEPGLL